MGANLHHRKLWMQLQKLDTKNSIILHTSGSLGMEIFPKGTRRFGVLYPFQTLTSGIKVDFSEIPLCIEGNDNETSEKIEDLAKRLSPSVHHIDSQQRQILHLAGVIGNNFTNYFMTLATELLQKHNMHLKERSQQDVLYAHLHFRSHDHYAR